MIGPAEDDARKTHFSFDESQPIITVEEESHESMSLHEDYESKSSVKHHLPFDPISPPTVIEVDVLVVFFELF